MNWEYPRLFITKALPLPNNMTKPYPKGFKSNRRRYNRLLQRGEQDNNYKTINLSEFTSENTNKFFTADGTITQQGYKNLWITISDAIHKVDNTERIILNKLRAKQLSAQISITSEELQALQAGDDNLSDIEMIPDDKEHELIETTDNTNQARRALLPDFNRPTTSPATSNISEYYTVQNNCQHLHGR